MRTRHRTAFAAFRTAQGFLHEYGHVLPAVAESGLSRRLDAIIDDLYRHTTDQVTHGLRAHSLVRTARTLRAELLRDHMTPIVRIARADLPHTPEFQSLRMPAGRPTLDRLASAAFAMAGIAERFAATFVAAGMPPTFVDALHAATREMIDARRAAAAESVRRSGATRAIEAAMADGLAVMRALDLLVSTESRRDAALLAQWKAVIATPRLGRPRLSRTRRHRSAAT
jgi:hypothetical protein